MLVGILQEKNKGLHRGMMIPSPQNAVKHGAGSTIEVDETR